jgi:hypothetical protein
MIRATEARQRDNAVNYTYTTTLTSTITLTNEQIANLAKALKYDIPFARFDTFADYAHEVIRRYSLDMAKKRWMDETS